MNAWTITQDFFADPKALPATNSNAVGLCGPSTVRLTSEQIMNAEEAQMFRMLDDDGIAYYVGYLIGDEFGPLDDFGGPNAGCTSIELYEGGVWVPV